MKILIKNGRLIDSKIDKICDIYILNDKINRIGKISKFLIKI